jgi:Ser/Thr protein kinase RdoA (MazF antagonist)
MSDSANRDFETVEELGRSVGRLATLLRAAVNSPDRDDESWLIDIALEQANEAEQRYKAWGEAPRVQA